MVKLFSPWVIEEELISCSVYVGYEVDVLNVVRVIPVQDSPLGRVASRVFAAVLGHFLGR
jgi:hypothetical protein